MVPGSMKSVCGRARLEQQSFHLSLHIADEMLSVFSIQTVIVFTFDLTYLGQV